MWWRALLARAPPRLVRLLQRSQFLVEEFRREILAVEPGNRGEPIVEVERREPRTIAQRLEALTVQLVGEVHHTFASIVEFQPHLVVVQITRFDDMPWYVLVAG